MIFGFKNIGLFSCFQSGEMKISSFRKPFLIGERGVRYGTPNDVVEERRQRCTNNPKDVPKNPNEPPSNI